LKKKYEIDSRAIEGNVKNKPCQKSQADNCAIHLAAFLFNESNERGTLLTYKLIT